MSTKFLYTVHDSKAEAYLDIFLQRAQGEAIRTFAQAVNSEGHSFNTSAGDYTLFEIAQFEIETGVITPHPAFINLGNGVDHVRTNNIVPISDALKGTS